MMFDVLLQSLYLLHFFCFTDIFIEIWPLVKKYGYAEANMTRKEDLLSLYLYDTSWIVALR